MPNPQFYVSGKWHMITSWYGNVFCSHQWFHHTKASNAGLRCLRYCQPERAVEQIIKLSVIKHLRDTSLRFNGVGIELWGAWVGDAMCQKLIDESSGKVTAFCPACRTTLVATRFRVAVICPIIQVPHCIRVFFYFVWFVFINHIFQFYYELCTYCNILDIYLS